MALRSESDAAKRFGTGVKKAMTPAALETLATRLLSEKHGRTMVLCRGSAHSVRNDLLFELVELLNWACDLPVFTSISDAPTLSAMNHFRLAVSSRGVRAVNSWMLLDASMEKAPLAHLRNKTVAAVYHRLEKAFE